MDNKNNAENHKVRGFNKKAITVEPPQTSVPMREINRKILQVCNAELLKNQNDPFALRGRADSLVSSKRFSAAIVAYRRCLMVCPQDWHGDIQCQLGRAYHALKKYDLAIKELRVALDMAWPNGEKKINIGKVYLRMGRVYKAWRKPREALWCFEKACAPTPRRVWTLAKEMAQLRKKSIEPKSPNWQNSK